MFVPVLFLVAVALDCWSALAAAAACPLSSCACSCNPALLCNCRWYEREVAPPAFTLMDAAAGLMVSPDIVLFPVWCPTTTGDCASEPATAVAAVASSGSNTRKLASISHTPSGLSFDHQLTLQFCLYLFILAARAAALEVVDLGKIKYFCRIN
jgi:hypothetical protein